MLIFGILFVSVFLFARNMGRGPEGKTLGLFKSLVVSASVTLLYWMLTMPVTTAIATVLFLAFIVFALLKKEVNFK